MSLQRGLLGQDFLEVLVANSGSGMSEGYFIRGSLQVPADSNSPTFGFYSALFRFQFGQCGLFWGHLVPGLSLTIRCFWLIMNTAGSAQRKQVSGFQLLSVCRRGDLSPRR